MLSNPIKRQFEGQEVEFFIDYYFTVWVKAMVLLDFIKDLPDFSIDEIEPPFRKNETIDNKITSMISIHGIGNIIQKGFIPNNHIIAWIEFQGLLIGRIFGWLECGGNETPWPEDIEFLKDIMAGVIGVDSSEFWKE